MDKTRHHIIGTGRWGSWLARRLKECGFSLASFRNRTASSAKRLAKELDIQFSSNSLKEGIPILEREIIWCCVPDDELVALSKSITAVQPKAYVVHCSGTSQILKGDWTGVFWPIQSFTASTAPDWSNLPIIVQANDPAFAKTLVEIASTLSGLSPKQVSKDEDRMRLHLGAVMTQNFSNLLWRLTEEVLAKADSNLDFKMLLPLAQNHLSKLSDHSPSTLQTGPASRGDKKTLNSHLELLKAHPEARKIYSDLSALITQKEA